MSVPWMLLALALGGSPPIEAVVPVAADDVAEEAEPEATEAEPEVTEAEPEEAEPFPWDMVAGALVMSGGLAAGAGLTAAGIGALFLTAPGTDPVIAPGGYMLLGAGAIVGLVGVVVVSTGGGILLFTGDDE